MSLLTAHANAHAHATALQRAARHLGVVAGLALAAVVAGPADAAEQARSVAPFEAVHLYGPFQVVLRQAAPAAVVVSADEPTMALIETRVVTRRGLPTLEIGWQRGVRPPPGRHEVTVRVDAASLQAIALSGAGTLRGEGLDGSALRVEVAGSGDVRLDGRSARLAIEIAGSGNVDTSGLAADEVGVEIAGSGDARVDAARSLAVSIVGSGDVSYAGNPVVSSSIAGSGRVRRR